MEEGKREGGGKGRRVDESFEGAWLLSLLMMVGGKKGASS